VSSIMRRIFFRFFFRFFRQKDSFCLLATLFWVEFSPLQSRFLRPAFSFLGRRILHISCFPFVVERDSPSSRKRNLPLSLQEATLLSSFCPRRTPREQRCSPSFFSKNLPPPLKNNFPVRSVRLLSLRGHFFTDEKNLSRRPFRLETGQRKTSAFFKSVFL